MVLSTIDHYQSSVDHYIITGISLSCLVYPSVLDMIDHYWPNHVTTSNHELGQSLVAISIDHYWPSLLLPSTSTYHQFGAWFCEQPSPKIACASGHEEVGSRRTWTSWSLMMCDVNMLMQWWSMIAKKEHQCLLMVDDALRDFHDFFRILMIFDGCWMTIVDVWGVFPGHEHAAVSCACSLWTMRWLSVTHSWLHHSWFKACWMFLGMSYMITTAASE